MATAFAEGEDFGRELAQMVKAAIAEAVAPLKAANETLTGRVAELETLPPPEKGEPGKDAQAPSPKAIWDAVRPDAETIIREVIAQAVAALPKPENGKDAANIVEALKDSGELVLTLQDGRLIRTGIRDGEDGKSADADEWGVGLSVEEKAGTVSAMLRKEIGDMDLIVLPDPLPVPSAAHGLAPVVVHNHLPKRGIEKTVVTKHDERGRVLEFERREV